jgi:hypothetical protein
MTVVKAFIDTIIVQALLKIVTNNHYNILIVQATKHHI